MRRHRLGKPAASAWSGACRPCIRGGGRAARHSPGTTERSCSQTRSRTVASSCRSFSSRSAAISQACSCHSTSACDWSHARHRRLARASTWSSSGSASSSKVASARCRNSARPSYSFAWSSSPMRRQSGRWLPKDLRPNTPLPTTAPARMAGQLRRTPYLLCPGRRANALEPQQSADVGSFITLGVERETVSCGDRWTPAPTVWLDCAAASNVDVLRGRELTWLLPTALS